MKLAIELLNDLTVIKVTEELVGDESHILLTEIRQNFNKGIHKLVVDLSETGQMDTKGIKSLALAQRFVSEGGGKFVVVNPQHFLVLQRYPFMHPIPFFELYRSKEEAIGALADPPELSAKATVKKRRGSGGCLGIILAVCLLAQTLLAIASLL